MSYQHFKRTIAVADSGIDFTLSFSGIQLAYPGWHIVIFREFYIEHVRCIESMISEVYLRCICDLHTHTREAAVSELSPVVSPQIHMVLFCSSASLGRRRGIPVSQYPHSVVVGERTRAKEGNGRGEN